MEPRSTPMVSFTHIAALLATLGGCTKAEPAGAVRADQPGATASATPASPPPPPTPIATVAPEEESQKKKEDKSAAAVTGGGGAAGGMAAPTATASAATQLRRAPTGQASCGAGTCSTDMKKKK